MTIVTASPTDQGTRNDPPDGTAPHLPDATEDQPDPVTLCQPSFDGDGLLRWASATFDVRR